jgi:hypothetical protein
LHFAARSIPFCSSASEMFMQVRECGLTIGPRQTSPHLMKPVYLTRHMP